MQAAVLSFGFWASFGSKPDIKDREGVEVAKACLRMARDGGINLIDHAETYGDSRGAAETIGGIAMQELGCCLAQLKRIPRFLTR